MTQVKLKPLFSLGTVVSWLPIVLVWTVTLSLLPSHLLWCKACGQTQGDASEAIDQARSDGARIDDSGLAMIQAVESTLVDVIAACEQSVVAISRVRSDQAVRSQLDTLRLGPSLQLSNDPTSEDFVPTFFGSGIVYDEDGLIVTCAHVLDDPRKYNYFVWLDRRCYAASVVGKSAQILAADPFSDLAVLRIEASGLKPLPLATDELRKGQFVISLGNPYAIARDGQASASWSIISNINRFAPRETDQGVNETIHQLGTMIHTDQRMQIGTSGGALVNMRGQLVGMTTNLLAGRGYEQSAGLAIATDSFFQGVISSLKQGRQPEFGFLGIQPDNLRLIDRDRGLSGARVSMVIPGLPGSQAGLREGDIIFQVGDAAVDNRNDLVRELSKVPSGSKARLLVHRSRSATNLQVVSLEADLTKKYLATNRPAYSLHGPPTWRGAQVEYQSAIVGELERIAIVRGGPKVALLSVAPDSPAWRAGLRAGYGLVSFNGQAIQSPAQFHEMAAQTSREVSLVVFASDGRQLTVVVQPEAN